MNIVQLVQGSPEWLAYRLSRRNASESAAVLGASPWTTPYQLWLLKTGRAVTPVTPAMQHGTDTEPTARAAYEAQTGNVMQPLVLEHKGYSASLDGITFDHDLILEIKCPVRGSRSDLWQDVAAGAVPEHYAIQVQHQLMVSDAPKAHLWIYDGQRGLLHEIPRDEAIMERIRAGWDAFQIFLDTDAAPPLTDADTVQRSDTFWKDAAAAFASAKLAADAADVALTAARDALVKLAVHPREAGAGVTVTKFWKAGNVAYAKIPALQGLDLTAWRGKSREEVRVTAG
jgi:putative phage-type endonuclease